MKLFKGTLKKFVEDMFFKYESKLHTLGYTVSPWNFYSYNQLLERLKEETNDLSLEIKCRDDIKDYKLIQKECINVANFCYFIYAKAEIKNKRGG